MSVLQTGLATPATGYTIDNSLRFNDDDSAYLSRTPSSAGNRRTWTWSGWVKRSNITNAFMPIFGTQADGSNIGYIAIASNNTLDINNKLNDSTGVEGNSTRLFRDVGAWYHLIISFDGNQSSQSDRVSIYVNGESDTFIPRGSKSSGAGYLNTAVEHTVGSIGQQTAGYSEFDGYLAEVNFVDGQALTPADFGETGDYGEWKPIRYTGTYGTNGFYLDFGNSGSLGTDSSGNSNNWTPTNLAATDQMLDTPTNNFATFNPLQRNATNITVSEGNLKSVGSGGWQTIGCTQAITGGKWYWEVCNINAGLTLVGVVDTENQGALFRSSAFVGNLANSYGYYSGDGKKYNISSTAYGATWQTTGDIIGIAYDADIGSITFYKNNVSQGVAFTGLTNNVTPAFSPHTGVQLAANFGQDSSFAGNKTAQGNTDGNGIGDFYYTPPTGYLALCTQNLPDPAVIPSEHFNTVTYTGDGTSGRAITTGFQPDLTWTKERSTVRNHLVINSISGGNKHLKSNTTDLEYSNSQHIQSYTSTGYTIGNSLGINTNNQTFVAWNWKANGTGVSNTDGTITSTVSANTDAGFSIVSYTGNATYGATVGHGLSLAPELVITKNRDVSQNWAVYNAFNGGHYYMYLDDTRAASDYHGMWNDAEPTNTVFELGSHATSNGSGNSMIAYCFHSVDGYSKVGSYTGNGSTDGTFVYTGFRPAYVMVKPTSRTGRWRIKDAARDVDNVMDKRLAAEDSAAESTGSTEYIDFLSNGFKARTSEGQWNGNGETNIYIAFAEHPFKHTNAR